MLLLNAWYAVGVGDMPVAVTGNITNLCTTNPSSYSVVYLPTPNATITWSASTSKAVSFQIQSGNIPTLTKLSNYNPENEPITFPGDEKIILQAAVTTPNGIKFYPTLASYVYPAPSHLSASADNSGTYIKFKPLYNTTQYTVHYVDLTNTNNQGYAVVYCPAFGDMGWGGSILLSTVPKGDNFQFQVAGNSPCGLTAYSDWYTFTPPVAPPPLLLQPIRGRLHQQT